MALPTTVPRRPTRDPRAPPPPPTPPKARDFLPRAVVNTPAPALVGVCRRGPPPPPPRPAVLPPPPPVVRREPIDPDWRWKGEHLRLWQKTVHMLHERMLNELKERARAEEAKTARLLPSAAMTPDTSKRGLERSISYGHVPAPMPVRPVGVPLPPGLDIPRPPDNLFEPPKRSTTSRGSTSLLSRLPSVKRPAFMKRSDSRTMDQGRGRISKADIEAPVGFRHDRLAGHVDASEFR